METKKKLNKFSIVFLVVAFIVVNSGSESMLFLFIALSFYLNKKLKWFKPVDLVEDFIKNNFNFSQADNRNDKEYLLDSGNVENKIVKNYLLNPVGFYRPRLDRKRRYLQVALNSTLQEAGEVIAQLPTSDRILVEVGTPLIKVYGIRAITQIKSMVSPGTYIVADGKCSDLSLREVEMMAKAGANAATCLGVAPVETINAFIEVCEKFNIDSMVDMMNVENPLLVIKKLKKPPQVVILHRGVDESEFSLEKQLPLYQIKQIKGNYNILVAVAGGDTIKDAQRAIFNDADIVVVWKSFYQSNDQTAQLARSFLQEVK